MLDSSDREFIRNQINKAIGSTDPEFGSNYSSQMSTRNQRKNKLGQKVKARQDNLAERIEYEKLRKFSDVVDKFEQLGVHKMLKGLSTTASAIGKSKLTTSAKNAFLYSNPLTLAIATNWDIISGVSKGAGKVLGGAAGILSNSIYQRFRTRKALPINSASSSAGKLIPAKTQKSISTSGTNYIMAKNAVFMGGKNYIIAAPAGNFKPFTMGQFTSESMVEAKNKLNLPPGPTIEGRLLKDSKAQLLQTKATNKILTGIFSLMNKKLLVTLLGVLAIGGAIIKLRGLFGVKPPSINTNPAPSQNSAQSKLKDAEAYQQLKQNVSDVNKQDVINQINKYNVGITQSEDLVSTGNSGRIKSLVGISNKIGTSFKGHAGEPYLLKDGGEVIEITRNKSNEDEYDVRFVRRNRTTYGGFYALNVVNPHYFCKIGEYKEKGEQIGFIGKNGRINFRDGGSSEQEKQDYMDLVNNYAQNNYQPQADTFEQNFTDRRRKDLVKNYKKLENKSKRSAKIIENSLPNKLIKKPTPNNKDQSLFNKSNYSSSSNNSQIATQQAKQANLQPTKQAQIKQPQLPSKDNKIALSMGKNKVRTYGISYPMDIAVANCDTFAV